MSFRHVSTLLSIPCRTRKKKNSPGVRSHKIASKDIMLEILGFPAAQRILSQQPEGKESVGFEMSGLFLQFV